MQWKIKEQAQKKHTVITKIWKSSEASVSGRYNTPPLREDLVPRSRMTLERNGRGRGKTKVASLTNEWNHEPWEVAKLEEMTRQRWTKFKTLRYQRGTRNIARAFVGWRIWNKSLTDQKEYESTPVEKRNKELHVNLGVCKAMNDENNGREVHASTPVERRCTRNKNDIILTALRLNMELIEQ